MACANLMQFGTPMLPTKLSTGLLWIVEPLSISPLAHFDPFQVKSGRYQVDARLSVYFGSCAPHKLHHLL